MALRRDECQELQGIQKWLKGVLCTESWVAGLVVGHIAGAANELEKVQAQLNTLVHEDWMKWLRGVRLGEWGGSIVSCERRKGGFRVRWVGRGG